MPIRGCVVPDSTRAYAHIILPGVGVRSQTATMRMATARRELSPLMESELVTRSVRHRGTAVS